MYSYKVTLDGDRPDSHTVAADGISDAGEGLITFVRGQRDRAAEAEIVAVFPVGVVRSVVRSDASGLSTTD